MGGLSCGYAAGRARWFARFHPLLVYAAAEAAIALYALAFPTLHATVDAIYLRSGGSLAIRTVLALALLLVPTALMGLTVPVMSRRLAAAGGTGRAAAALLAANTLGGVAGTLGTAWVLVRVYGAAVTSELVTMVNLAVAVLALLAAAVSPSGSAGGDAPFATGDATA